jgi:glycerophosphoryl diester phosphodiesterase
MASRFGLTVPGRQVAAFTVPERHRSLTIVDRKFVTTARRAGRPVHVWTVDDPVDAARLRAIGVNGIITNYPSRM